MSTKNDQSDDLLQDVPLSNDVLTYHAKYYPCVLKILSFIVISGNTIIIVTIIITTSSSRSSGSYSGSINTFSPVFILLLEENSFSWRVTSLMTAKGGLR